MRYISACGGIILVAVLFLQADAHGRGFGGYRGGGFGGDRFSGYGGDRFGGRSDFGGDRSGGYRTDGFGGYRGGDSFRGNDFSGNRSSFDRPTGGPQTLRFDDNRGGLAGGESRLTFPTDAGLSRYSSLSVNTAHSTHYWSNSTMANRAVGVRSGFGYYNTFRGGWYDSHPGAWRPAAWRGAGAWAAARWGGLYDWWGIPVETPVYYDYGNNVTYQGDNVYVNGTETATAQDYASQAINLATQGQQASPPASDQWQSLGVFALVQGQETTSNNLFQLAVNQAGILRGNYYDGIMDSTTPVYGSVDKKTERAAWTIGKKADRVFEAGIYNLTQDQCPVLVHFGKDRTQQWLLVRMQEPQSGNSGQ